MTRRCTLLAALLLVPLGAAGPAAAQKKPAAKPTPAPAASPKPDTPTIFDPEADGDLSLAYYQDIAKRSNRRLIVVFGTNECAACQVVNAAVSEKRFYAELAKQFVPAFIDATPGTPGGEIPARYGIAPKAPLPGVVIFEPSGRVTEVLAKGEMAEVARKGKEAVQLWILERFDRNKPD